MHFGVNLLVAGLLVSLVSEGITLCTKVISFSVNCYCNATFLVGKLVLQICIASNIM